MNLARCAGRDGRLLRSAGRGCGRKGRRAHGGMAKSLVGRQPLKGRSALFATIFLSDFASAASQAVTTPLSQSPALAVAAAGRRRDMRTAVAKNTKRGKNNAQQQGYFGGPIVDHLAIVHRKID